MKSTLLFSYLLPIVIVAAGFSLNITSAQTRKESIVSAPPVLSLEADAATVTACSSPNKLVKLTAHATSPGGYPIRYQWSTESGRIDGTGSAVMWDLAGLPPGSYKARVNIVTGSSDNACEAFSSINLLVTACPPVRPVCPTVSIVCPNEIALDQPVVFNANVSGGTPTIAPHYVWTVSGGTIIEGQGTSSIRVDTSGLAGQTLRATLSMPGYTLDCSATCAVQIPVPQPRCRKFDEFPDIARNDEKARLDNFAIELQNDPTSTAYILVSPGRDSKAGDTQKRSARVIDYLVNSRRIDGRRLLTIVGKRKDELMVELWSCPQGAPAPRP